MEMEDDDENDEYGPELMDDIKDDKWDKILPKTVDEVFETFARKLHSAEDGEHQVLRYELGGVPLPYASTSPLFKQLFPKAPNMAPKAQGDEEDIDVSPFYDPSSVPRCPKCSSARVFEMQLVPSLISTLRPDMMTTTGEKAEQKAKKQLTEAERKAELQRMAKGEGDGEDSEMEWGTVMIFGCEKDCVGFREEWVGVEWENPGV
jgi:pre-rRNA-processing protein TSR4